MRDKTIDRGSKDLMKGKMKKSENGGTLRLVFQRMNISEVLLVLGPVN